MDKSILINYLQNLSKSLDEIQKDKKHLAANLKDFKLGIDESIDDLEKYDDDAIDERLTELEKAVTILANKSNFDNYAQEEFGYFNWSRPEIDIDSHVPPELRNQQQQVMMIQQA